MKQMGRSEGHAGAIFMCSSLTKGDCLRYKVLGLPMAKKHLVDKIVPGTKLFLFDFDAKLLHGVFEAVTHGGLNLVPEAYQECAGSYPAQVRFEVLRECLPVSEDILKDTIKDNYYSANKFNYELTEDQVNRLIQVFCPIEPDRLKGRGDDRQGASRSVFSRLSGAGKKLQSGGKPYDHKEPRAARYGSPELVHPPRKKDKKHIGEEDHDRALLRRSGSADVFPLNPKLREVAYPSPRRNHIGESDRPRRYVSDRFHVQESDHHSLPPRSYAEEVEHFDAFPGGERGLEEFIKPGHSLREEFVPYRDCQHLPKRPIDDGYFVDLPRREPVHNREYGGHLPREFVDERSHGQFIKRVKSPLEIEFEDDGHYYERLPRRESTDNRDYGQRPRREPMDVRKFTHLPRKEPLDDRDYDHLEKRPGSLMRMGFEDDEHYSRRLPTRETVDDVNNGHSLRRSVSHGKRELPEDFNGHLPRRSSSLMKRKLIDDDDKDNRHQFEYLPQYGSPSEREFAKDKDRYGPSSPRRPASLLKRDFVGDEEYSEHLSRRPRSYVVLQQQDVQRPSDDYVWPSTAELLQLSHIEEIDQLALRYMQPPDHFPDVGPATDTVLPRVHKWNQ